MPKLTITLTQHTPILQFHEEEGAGIRGTELKPSLDRFLWKMCGGEMAQWKLQQREGAVIALDYRVKIVDTAEKADLREQEQKDLRKTGYFSAGMEKPKKGAAGMEKPEKGAAGMEKTEKGAVVHHVMIGTGATVTFLSAHAALLERIRAWIIPYFACHNFGYRKSKGFGSYAVAAIDGAAPAEAIPDAMRRALGGRRLFEITRSNCPVRGGWLDVLMKTATVSAVMKSGSNLSYMRNPTYDRSILMKGYGYAGIAREDGTKPTYSNEKKLMKTGIRAVHEVSSTCDEASEGPAQPEQVDFIRHPDASKYRFARAMLGFADQYKFRESPDRFARSVTAYAYDAQHPQKGAFRFESPLLFKPVRIGGEWHVFILQREVPPEMFGREFYFSTIEPERERGAGAPDKVIEDSWKRRDDRTICLRTPDETEFNLEEFLTFVAEYDPAPPAPPVRLQLQYPLLQEVT